METSTRLRLSKGTNEIRNLDDWRRLAGPKSANQWVPGRSAMECARAWCGDGEIILPREILSLLNSLQPTRGVTLLHGEPEKRIPFDDSESEPRNADVAFLARAVSGKVVAITIEAKADETFGQTFQEALASGVERTLSGMKSNAVRRAEGLANALLPPRRFGKKVPKELRTPAVGLLRYQLLTAVAGTLAFAEQSHADLALLIVHEFVTDETEDRFHRANARDLDAFVTRFSDGRVRHIEGGQLAGPFLVNDNPGWPSRPTLYIGKATRNLRGDS